MQFQTLRGEAVRPHIKQVAQFRIKVFREYPYLYEGNLAYEEKYLQGFVNTADALLILAKENDKLIAIATSLPLCSDADILGDTENLFTKAGYKPNDFYYFAEIMVLPEHRHKGIAKKIYQLRLKEALDCGFKYLSFAAIVKPKNDPSRPSGYFNPYTMWKEMGFKPQENIIIKYTWPTIQPDDSVMEQTHDLMFWFKLIQ